MRSHLKSDHLLAQESIGDPSILTDVFDQYKVLVINANNGGTSPLESSLTPSMVALLHARRLMKRQKFDQVISLLNQIEFSENLLLGDRHFILSMAFCRLGNITQSNLESDLAIQYFKLIDDPHRLLRAKINKAIYNQTLESLTKGELFFLFQNAKRIGAEDLCGNIAKSKAIELAKVGLLPQALLACEQAIQSYEMAGRPEDLNVAHAMHVIVQILAGSAAEANKAYRQIFIFDGKVTKYLEVIESLKNGVQIDLPAIHPLHGIQLVYKNSRRRSVTGKIVDLLRISPLTRQELVSKIWGENVDYESHCNRLYVAINRLRTKMGIQILFDGEKYQIG